MEAGKNSPPLPRARCQGMRENRVQKELPWKSYSRNYTAFFRFPFIFPLAHRAFIAFEMRA